MITVTYLILTWNRKDALRRHLTLLSEQTYQEPFEVIVCVDGSTDGTQEMLTSWPAGYRYSLTWLDTGNIDKNTAAQAKNMGIKIATGKILIMVDDDCLPHPELIENYLKEFNSQVIQVGYKSNYEDYLSLDLPVPIEDGLMSIWMEAKTNAEFHYFQTGNVCMPIEAARTRAKDSSIGFDERFVGYGHEDSEFGRRLAIHGYTFSFNTNAVAWHMNPWAILQQDPELKATQAKESNVRLLQIIAEDPLIVGTFMSSATYGFFPQLSKQIEEAKIPFEVGYPEGEFINDISVYSWLLPFLDRHRGKKVLLTDGADVFLNCLSKEEIAGKIDAPIIFAAERNCFPEVCIAKDFPVVDTPWKYVNGGGIAGYADELYEFLKNLLPQFMAGICNQYLYSLAYISGIGKLDSQCCIWHCLFQGEHNDLIKVNDVCYQNTITGETPCLIHGNGGSWQHRPDIFSRGEIQ